MDQRHYNEMSSNLRPLILAPGIREKRFYLFGHCNATETLTDLLLDQKCAISGILDNNPAKYNTQYRGIPIIAPKTILSERPEEILVCTVARAYAAMADQLKRMGYQGRLYKLVDYNSYAEYSLSEETWIRMSARVERGIMLLDNLSGKYPGYFRFLCPFSALGDIYYMMSYLPHFMRKKGIEECVIGVIGTACAQTVRLFGEYPVEIFSQKNMDETIQAALYTQDQHTFIPHQDRPYVVNLHRALYVKMIPLEKIYCCGVFGLSADTKPVSPVRFQKYSELERIRKGKSVIFAPYAKSVTALRPEIWRRIVEYYLEKGYECYTNVVGGELPLPDTQAISPEISEVRSVVEYAGTFIGLRSGLCDILRTACGNKTALYPDYYYSDTKWKAVDMYWLEDWDNIVVKDDFTWERR